MKTLTFLNLKGGNGKTTSALSVAAGLARKGYRVLLVDLDQQGNASKAAGVAPDETDPTAYEVLTGTARALDAIRTAPGGYDVLTADIRQAGIDIKLANAERRNYLLLDALDSVADLYDYAIIDSPASLSVVTLMALTATNGVIITLKADFLGLDAVPQLRDTIALIKKDLNPDIEVTGILLTFYDRRRNLDKQVEAYAERGFPGKVFSAKIPQDTRAAEAPGAGLDIFQYAPRSSSAKQYAQLVEEIVDRTK